MPPFCDDHQRFYPDCESLHMAPAPSESVTLTADELRKIKAQVWEECATAWEEAPEIFPGMVAEPVNPYEED